jgi:hypothetical protein
MSNPLLKKNPFMSMWLSGANKAAATGRGLWAAAARKQQSAMIRDAAKMTQDFWSGILAPSAARKRNKSKK